MSTVSTFQKISQEVAEQYGFRRNMNQVFKSTLLQVDYDHCNKDTLDENVEDLLYFFERINNRLHLFSFDDCLSFLETLSNKTLAGERLKVVAQAAAQECSVNLEVVNILSNGMLSIKVSSKMANNFKSEVDDLLAALRCVKASPENLADYTAYLRTLSVVIYQDHV